MSNEQRTRSCAERLPEHLASRLEDFERIMDALEAPDATDDLDRFDELEDERINYPLAVTTELLVTFQISTGGPGDQFEVVLDPADPYGAQRITYRFLDWFDGANKELTGPDFERAERFLSWWYELVVSMETVGR